MLVYIYSVNDINSKEYKCYLILIEDVRGIESIREDTNKNLHVNISCNTMVFKEGYLHGII
jgi:hypothetical protein